VGLGYSLLLFLGVWLMRRRWPFAGASFLLYTFLYVAGQFFLEFTRGDEAIYVGPWRLAQVLNLVLALAAGVALLVLWWRWRTVGEEREEPIEEVEETQATGDAPEVQKVEGMDQEPVAEEPVSAPQSAMPEERDDPAENEELEGDSPTGE
jgi:membrane protein implicated in regulation of membrane protease activity